MTGITVAVAVGVSVHPGTMPNATNGPPGGCCWLSEIAKPIKPARMTISTNTAEMITTPPFLERVEINSFVVGMSTRVGAETCEELSRGMTR